MEWINVIDTEQGAYLDNLWLKMKRLHDNYMEQFPESKKGPGSWKAFTETDYPNVVKEKMEELTGEGKAVYHPEEPGAGLNLNGEWLDPRENLTPVLELLTDCRTATHYGEPGYHTEDAPAGILFANWNEVGDGFTDYLEGLGFGVEWLDEWVIAHRNGEDYAYRSQPDSYQWSPSFIHFEGEVIGVVDVEKDEATRDWYVNEYLANNPEAANVLNVDLSEYGFKELSAGHQNGLHKGMNADPAKLLRNLRKQYREADFIFGDLKSSQFYTEFSIYGRNL